MRELPILFSAPMVRAILEGRKTQTRRVINPAPQMVTGQRIEPWEGPPAALLTLLHQSNRRCRYGAPGDRMWVRETWGYGVGCGVNPTTEAVIEYRADSTKATLPVPAGESGLPKQRPNMTDAELLAWWESWRPSIHMPRWASRITLEVTGVRVERLRTISEADAIAEGIHVVQIGSGYPDRYSPTPVAWADVIEQQAEAYEDPCMAYQDLWESINGAGSWDANPWVWVVEFRRIDQVQHVFEEAKAS